MKMSKHVTTNVRHLFSYTKERDIEYWWGVGVVEFQLKRMELVNRLFSNSKNWQFREFTINLKTNKITKNCNINLYSVIL